MIRALLLAAAVPATASGTQEGDAMSREAQVAAFVDAHLEEAIALLQRVVDINSGTMNFDGVRAVGDVFRAELDALGFRTRWVPGDAFGRAGHLVAEKPGSGPRLLLIGHLDTVFEPDSPFQRFQRDGWTATGPGVLDMKGGDVVLLYALKAIAAAGRLEEMAVSVILTGDEESTGAPLSEGRGELRRLAEESHFAIGFEDGDGDTGTAVIARRGSSSWEIEVGGVRAHSSLIHKPEVGAGAIFEAGRILSALHGIRDEGMSLSAGLVLGGTSVDFDRAHDRGSATGKENVVPERVVITGDLRPTSQAQLEEVRQRIREAVAASLPRTRAEVRFRDSYPPMEATTGNRRVLALLDQASRDLQLGPVSAAPIHQLGAADVSFAAPHVEGAIDGLGLGGRGGHTVAETADLRTLALQAKRAAALMLRLSGGGFGEGD